MMNLNNVIKKDLKLFSELILFKKIYKILNDRESKLKALDNLENILNELDINLDQLDKFIKQCYEEVYEKRLNIYRQLDEEGENE